MAKTGVLLVTLTAAVLASGPCFSAPAKPLQPGSGTRIVPKAKSAPVWRPDPKLLRQLGNETHISSIAIRVPPDYVYTMQHQGTVRDYIWQGARHGDSYPQLTIVESTDDRGPGATLTPTELLAAYLAQRKADGTAWTESPSESGIVNGRKWARVRFRYAVPQVGRPRAAPDVHRGFAFATVNGHDFTVINGEDLDPYADSVLPLLSTAALTFHHR